MRWGSFIFGIIFIVIGILTGPGIIIFGILGFILVIYGLGESEPEKVQKQHLEETQKLREDLQSMKDNTTIKEQVTEIGRLKKDILELKKQTKKK